MAGNTFGLLFRVTTFGESHGGAVGAVIDGCPPGLELNENDIQPELDRRKPGQSSLTTPRKEADTIKIASGVFEGNTTGTPILLIAHNNDARPGDYNNLKDLYRPSHADYTYYAKYGLRDWRGSGRASARETLARVAAGAIAKKLLRKELGIETLAYVQQVGNLVTDLDPSEVTTEKVESSLVRCPDPEASKKMVSLIESIRDEGDSIGGVIVGRITGVPAGLGEPVFDKLHAELGKAMLSINAVKGFDIGSGFAGVSLKGSVHNDPFITDSSGRVRTTKNHAGGVLGGISSGETIVFRVAFKPVATISKSQNTIDHLTKLPAIIKGEGRHDPCVLPRAVPIVEAMSALTIVDHWLRQRAQYS